MRVPISTALFLETAFDCQTTCLRVEVVFGFSSQKSVFIYDMLCDVG